MVRKSEVRHVAGGRCFGYDNLKIVGPTGQPSHTERRINDAEAAVVRRIFELCAAGKGVKAIAKMLNADGAPTPQPINRQVRGWAGASVRAVLYRRTYLGEIVYAATKPCDAWGPRQYGQRPESEWLRVPQPAWRVVGDELWTAAHQRLAATAQTYLRINGGRLWGGRRRGWKAGICSRGFRDAPFAAPR
jgi:site-specific DNA recombinase